MMRLIAVLSLLGAPGIPSTVALASEDRPIIIAEAVIQKHGAPGLAVAVVKGDEIVFAQAAGVRRHESESRIGIEDRFHLGACTKPLTATLAAVLVREGEIRLDETVAEVFPEWADSMHEMARGMTLEHLLSHRAGVVTLLTGEMTDDDLELVEDLKGTPAEQRLAFAQRVLRRQPINVPGETYRYSNGGYAVAAAMLERKTGESWQALLAQHVFEPLGMKSAVFGFPAKSIEDQTQPWGHFGVAGDPESRPARRLTMIPPDPRLVLPPILEAAGDVSCSVIDLARFAQMHLRGLVGKDTIVPAATVADLHAPRLNGYALGWFETDHWGGRATAHNGSSGTFAAWIVIWPRENLAVVACSNAGGPGDLACREMIEWMYRLYGDRAEDIESADEDENVEDPRGF